MDASAYHVISKKAENQIFRQNWIFRHTCVYKQTTLTKEWNYNIFVQMLYSYFMYTGKLFLGCPVFVACCNIIRALWETKKKERLSCRKKCKEEFAWGTSLFWLHTLTTMSFFCCFFCLLSFPSDVVGEWP